MYRLRLAAQTHSFHFMILPRRPAQALVLGCTPGMVRLTEGTAGTWAARKRSSACLVLRRGQAAGRRVAGCAAARRHTPTVL